MHTASGLIIGLSVVSGTDLLDMVTPKYDLDALHAGVLPASI